jgi:HSP20 family protein
MPFRQWRPAGNFLAVPEASQHLLQTAWAHDRGRNNSGVTDPWKPAMDIDETDDALVREVALPGVAREAISVALHEPTVTLTGERTREPTVKGGRYGAFRRVFRLPISVDQGKVHAIHKTGGLTLRLPKRDAAPPQGVPIPGEDRDGTCGRLGIGPRPDAPLRAR